MKTRNALIIILAAGLIMLLVGFLLGQQMGPRLAIHWNAAGEADGYGSLFMGLYFLPLLAMGISTLILFIPAIDPLKKNIAVFREDYNLFILSFAGFFYYLHGITLAWNLGASFSMNAALAPALGLFFILTGWMIGKAKRNYFIGIRTPWTLANDEVWTSTHQLGGRLFIASGILTMLCVMFPDAAISVLLFTAIGSSVITMVFSYFEYRRIEKRNSME